MDAAGGEVEGEVLRHSLSATQKGGAGIVEGIVGGVVVFFVLVLVLWLVWFFYFLPSRIAAGNKNANKVYKVNLLLGWIPVVWLLVLFAALIGDSRED